MANKFVGGKQHFFARELYGGHFHPASSSVFSWPPLIRNNPLPCGLVLQAARLPGVDS